MAKFKRYIPKSKYTEPKYTSGGEFINKTTQKDYTGYYIETYRDRFYAGKSPQQAGDEIVKIKSEGIVNKGAKASLFLLLTALAKGFFKPSASSVDKDNGFTTRYFIQDKSTNKIVETDKNTYLQAQDQIPNQRFATADWIIKGPAENQVINGYPFEGAASKNKKTIQALESQIPGISTFVTDYSLLVEEPVVNQELTLSTVTEVIRDPNAVQEDFRKARFDKRSDLIFPSASISNSSAGTVQSIITDGLILNLDAGNTTSYPGTGTTWTDLSGNGNDGTLLNGPIYDSANGGSLVFDGSDDQVTMAGVTVSTTSTINLWVYPIPSSDGYGTLLTQGASYGIWYRGGSQKVTSYYTTDHLTSQTLTENQWNNIVVVNNGGDLSFYINNILDPNTYTSAVSFTANAIGNDTVSENFKGKISNVQIYDRVLTPKEISYNFNVLRTRYGI